MNGSHRMLAVSTGVVLLALTQAASGEDSSPTGQRLEARQLPERGGPDPAQSVLLATTPKAESRYDLTTFNRLAKGASKELRSPWNRVSRMRAGWSS